jgi:hypothetical protein
MWGRKINHPCQFTLGLFAAMIEKVPAAFPAERLEAMKRQYDGYNKDKKIACAYVEKALVDFGREIWPYRKAWQEIYDKYGRAKEAEFFEKHLPEELHHKYFACKVKGGGHCLREYRMCGLMETCFNPDEKFFLDETVIKALGQAREAADKIIAGEKKDEYEEALKKWSAEQKKMEEKISELEKMAAVEPKWRAEIEEKVKTIEQGWSIMEREITLKDIQQIIDFYQGAIENPEAY